MKTIQTLFFILFLAVNQSFAQPGDPDLKHRLRWFNEAQYSVIEYPDNLYYRWVRLDILFNPYFQVQTKPTKDLKDYLTSSNQFYQYVADTLVESFQPCDMCRFKNRKKYNPASKLGSFLLFNQNQLISDLTDLIKSDTIFRSRFTNSIGGYVQNPNKSHFLYKRGQFYYLSGEAKKGLNDYLSALKYSPNEEMTKRIYTSIAAYYYTIQNSELQENYDQALKFIRLAEPVMEDSSYYKGKEPHDYQYESAKLDLMKRYNDSTSYVNYLQNRAVSYLNYYYSLMETMKPEDHYYYKCDNAFERSREYELMIYNYLTELNPTIGAEEFKKHKKLIIEKI